jgi:hypothetical protein
MSEIISAIIGGIGGALSALAWVRWTDKHARH